MFLLLINIFLTSLFYLNFNNTNIKKIISNFIKKTTNKK